MALRRGEVYMVDLDPTTGREQGGRRPVVVVSNDALNKLPLVVAVVPGMRGSKQLYDFQSNVRVPAGTANLPLETVFLSYQARALDHSRFRDPPIGVLSAEYLEKVERALLWTFSIAAPSSP